MVCAQLPRKYRIEWSGAILPYPKAMPPLWKAKVHLMVIANINRNILLADMKHYIARMNPGAELLMSGFYIDDIPVIREEAERNGLHFVHHREKNRWAAVKFQK